MVYKIHDHHEWYVGLPILPHLAQNCIVCLIQTSVNCMFWKKEKKVSKNMLKMSHRRSTID